MPLVRILDGVLYEQVCRGIPQKLSSVRLTGLISFYMSNLNAGG